jgi:hypothetical protein
MSADGDVRIRTRQEEFCGRWTETLNPTIILCRVKLSDTLDGMLILTFRALPRGKRKDQRCA